MGCVSFCLDFICLFRRKIFPKYIASLCPDPVCASPRSTQFNLLHYSPTASIVHQLPVTNPQCYSRRRSSLTVTQECWPGCTHKVLAFPPAAQAYPTQPRRVGVLMPPTWWQIWPIRGQKWARAKRKIACPSLQLQAKWPKMQRF